MIYRTRLLAATAVLAVALSACSTMPPPSTVPVTPVDPAPIAAETQGPIDTVDQSATTQLPRTAVPRHYAITVTPDAPNLRFAGKVSIDLDVVQPTDRLVLNAADLDFKTASLSGPGGTRTGTATLDAPAQTATIAFGQTLSPGRYTLVIDYAGKINTQANGLFALDYKDPAGASKRSLFTQFEAPDARRFVPSWDEPDYKATWDLTAIVPAGQMAVGNMPAAKTETLADGRSKVTFQTTPTMSSYLLFFGTGEFGRIAKMAGNTEVGIVMGRGNEEKARTALDAEATILPYYNDYFGTPYPLPKLDNVAGPGQSQFFGAMENWGAIFTFERILLDDPAITTENDRHAIFEVEAHEMAHQWFGDLVTMAWWDDLWLNEGFASWMENRTTHHFHPDWGADIDRIGSREAAMDQDAYVTTHPIVQKITTVEQTNQAFDSITYSKGQSVIAMLEAYAGGDVWQRGIQAYIKQHQYQNTRTDDLWRAVEAAGATGLTQVAHDFTLQPGIPMLRVGAARCAGGSTSVTVVQDEFSADRAPGKFAARTWHVPVTARTLGGDVVRAVATGPSTDLTLPACGPVLINADQTGYFRTLYQPAQVKALRDRFTTLGAVDQYGLLQDNFALSSAGYQPMGRALDLHATIGADANPKVVGVVIANLHALYDLFDGNPAAQSKIAAMMSARFGPLLRKIGFAPVAGEPAMIATLRPALIGTLGAVGDQSVRAEAARLFAALASNPNAIPGSLKTTWLNQVARNATPAEWERIHQMAKDAPTAVTKTSYYQLLGRAEDPALARRALELALTDEPGATVSAGIINAAAAVDPQRTLDFVLAHLPEVGRLVDSSARSRFVARLAGESDDMATIDKLNRYAEANLAASDRKPVEAKVAEIRARIAANPRIRRETLAWLNGTRR